MDEKSDDLEDAVWVPPPEETLRKAGAKASKHPPGYLYMSAQIKARLTPQAGSALKAAQRAKASVSGPALQVLCCLLDLEFRAFTKGEPILLSNVAVSYWGVSRHQKMPGLNELRERGIATYTQEGRESPRVTLAASLMK